MDVDRVAADAGVQAAAAAVGLAGAAAAAWPTFSHPALTQSSRPARLPPGSAALDLSAAAAALDWDRGAYGQQPQQQGGRAEEQQAQKHSMPYSYILLPVLCLRCCLQCCLCLLVFGNGFGNRVVLESGKEWKRVMCTGKE